MKKNKLLRPELIVIFLSFAVFFSCSKESVELNNNDGELITSKELEFVGKDHNSILNKAYVFLKSNQENKNKIKLEEFLINDVKSNNLYSKQSNDIGIELIKKEFSKTSFVSKSLYGKQIISELSENEKKYLDKLNLILSNVDFNDKNVITSISNLEKEIEEDKALENKQLITLYSATQTARYSYNYWSKNYDEWASLSQNTTTKQAKASPGKNVVKADVAGAVGAAAATWVANAVPGAGQVAYGSAIASGAAASSIGQAVLELLEWW